MNGTILLSHVLDESAMPNTFLMLCPLPMSRLGNFLFSSTFVAAAVILVVVSFSFVDSISFNLTHFVSHKPSSIISINLILTIIIRILKMMKIIKLIKI